MNERQVERSDSEQSDEDPKDGGVWRMIVDRLVADGEPLANALRIADRIMRGEGRASMAPDSDAGGSGSRTR
jgi:hypothetical protein